MAKAKEKWAEQYDSRLAINGSFAHVIKVSVTNPEKLKERLPQSLKMP